MSGSRERGADLPTVRAAYDALLRGEFDAVVDLFDDDLQWQGPKRGWFRRTAPS